VHYGWYEIRVHDPTTQDRVIDGVGAVQRRIADALDASGPTVTAVVVATLLITAVVLVRVRRARGARR
jgi:cytochrome c-type biogenesis protein